MAIRSVSCPGRVTNTGNTDITAVAALTVDYETNNNPQPRVQDVRTSPNIPPGSFYDFSLLIGGVNVSGGDTIAAFPQVWIQTPSFVLLLDLTTTPTVYVEAQPPVSVSGTASGFVPVVS